MPNGVGGVVSDMKECALCAIEATAVGGVVRACVLLCADRGGDNIKFVAAAVGSMGATTTAEPSFTYSEEFGHGLRNKEKGFPAGR